VFRGRLIAMAARDPLPRWGRWFIGVVGLLVVGMIAWGAWPKWSTATIGSVSVDGARLEVLSDACSSEVRAEYRVRAESVVITVSARAQRNVDCSGSVSTIVLDEPLGDRLLVDGSDDAVLTCEPAGAVTQECVR
jgi:hypothetical protein